jgi:2-polyprenyl-6-hydroxyphenyl methylase/3-demethylubiquinone-9 3-methyltransferase
MKVEKTTTSTVDDAEIERFTRMASQWWDTNGKFAPLHRINPLRIGYIRDKAQQHFSLKEGNTPLSGLTLVDIGCGGGLISEPMARMGAQVTGIDAGDKNIAVAKLHAEQSGLNIDYRCTTAEALVETGAQFDIVVALEIIEHVANVEEFIAASAKLLKPGGLMFYSTMNRTPKAYALAIIGAEYVMRWLPIGTHDWKKFLKPSELVAPLRRNHIDIVELMGMVMNPLSFQWRLDTRDVSVNYLVVGKKVKP